MDVRSKDQWKDYLEVSVTSSENKQPDLISRIATVGAPLVVGVLFVARLFAGHWGSIAFMSILFTLGIFFYLRFVPLENLDEDSHTQEDIDSEDRCRNN